MTLSEVRTLLGSRVAAAGSARAWAEANNVSAVYVTDVLNRGKEPGPKLLVALGLEKVFEYRTVAPTREGRAPQAAQGEAAHG